MLGVPIFFVISGYCIAAAADSSRRRASAGASFFLRRFRRIYPPYWIFLVGTVAILLLARMGGVLWLFDDDHFPISWPGSLSTLQWLGNLTLTETWRQYVAGGPTKFLTGHAWTLCYEEQFYLISGLILLAAPRKLFSGMIGVTLVTLGVMTLRFPLNGFFLDGSWLLFAEGVAVYYWLNRAELHTRRVLLSLFVVVPLVAASSHSTSWWHYSKFVEGPALAHCWLPFGLGTHVSPRLAGSSRCPTAARCVTAFISCICRSPSWSATAWQLSAWTGSGSLYSSRCHCRWGCRLPSLPPSTVLWSGGSSMHRS